VVRWVLFVAAMILGLAGPLLATLDVVAADGAAAGR
jgi:hypothetical protein